MILHVEIKAPHRFLQLQFCHVGCSRHLRCFASQAIHGNFIFSASNPLDLRSPFQVGGGPANALFRRGLHAWTSKILAAFAHLQSTGRHAWSFLKGYLENLTTLQAMCTIVRLPLQHIKKRSSLSTRLQSRPMSCTKGTSDLQV